MKHACFIDLGYKIMAENPSLPLALAQSPQTPRRGRPRGSGNKRSSDLKRYIEARFAGMTPGQQAAELCMVTDRELRAAAKSLKASGIIGISPMAVALGRRAHALSAVLSEGQPADDRCTPKEAMAILIKAQGELMPYIHQRQAQAEPVKADGAKTFVIGMPDPSYNPMVNGKIAAPPLDPDGLENAGLFDAMPEQVSQPKSHEPT